MARTVFRSCNLCEAACGLRFEVAGSEILSVRPDPDDVFSQGYACPKGIAIAEIQADPDRLRRPVRRTPSGDFQPIDWDEAMELAASRLGAVRDAHGKDAVAVYVGNPVVHNHGALLMRGPLLQALGTRNAFSAGSQDTSPRFATSFHLYGCSLSLPIPDVDRTDHLLCLGANPLVSNGSVLTAPNVRERLRRIRTRGGRIVVVDPRRSETAREADEHVAILPGGDAALLLGMLRVLLDEDRLDRAALARTTTGWDAVEGRLRRLDLDAAARQAGVPLETIARLARDFAAAARPVAYSRIGVCNSRFATVATYATDLLDLATGRLGAIGGAMFPAPAIDATRVLRMPGQDGHGRWRSRVRGLPETLGDIPASCMAEEIETPGEGQVRALLTFAGNPVLSTPNGRRLAKALEQLDFMVSIDLYVNETTRHADLILPPAWTLAEDHVDLIAAGAAVRTVARWSPPVVEAAPGERADWEILLDLTERLGGGPTGEKAADAAIGLLRRLGWQFTPTRMADLLLRTGRHGDRFLPWSRGLSMAKLRRAPHGIDLGPMPEGTAHRIFHPGGRARVDAAPLLDGLDAWLEELPAARAHRDGELLLIGRRELRTNNSWMHNAPSLVSGRERCVLLVHPEDAERAGIADGHRALLASRVHTAEVQVRVSDEMRPGVVSLPHGWGHAESAPWQTVSTRRPGVSANDWSDDQDVERVVGQSILNGVPVHLRAAAP